MKLIKPKVENLGPVPLFGTPESFILIETAGRTCYKSETEEITENTALSFIGRMMKSGHMSVLEHSLIVFRLDKYITNQLEIDINRLFFEESFINHYTDYENDTHYIAGNFRAWLEFVGMKWTSNKCTTEDTQLILSEFYEELFEIFEDNSLFPDMLVNIADVPRELRRTAFRYTTDRAVMAELTRHRKDIAFSIESQRYVSYKKGVAFIAPYWYSTGTEDQKTVFLSSVCIAEEAYKDLIECGLPKQAARGVLPNAAATTIFMTADDTELEHIYNLRCSKAAHPDIKHIMDISKEGE